MVGTIYDPITELLHRLAGDLIQTQPAASRALLPRGAVGGVYEDLVVSTLACPTVWGGEAQLLAVSVVFCALV